MSNTLSVIIGNTAANNEDLFCYLGFEIWEVLPICALPCQTQHFIIVTIFCTTSFNTVK